MTRSKITSRIPDLQVEWATSHQNISVRQFLMDKKGFTERQYRHALNQTPILNWEATATEVNNELSVEKIKHHAEEAVRILGLSAKVANMMLTRANKRLNDPVVHLSSAELLALASTVERCQRTYIAALGPDTYRAASPVAKIDQLNIELKQPKPEPTNAAPADPR